MKFWLFWENGHLLARHKVMEHGVAVGAQGVLVEADGEVEQQRDKVVSYLQSFVLLTI